MPSVFISLFILLGFILLGVLYTLTLYKTLQLIDSKNRKMKPAMVWFVFIPIFNFIWHFVIVSKLSESISQQYRQTGYDAPEYRPTYGIGIIASITWMLGFIIGLFKSDLTLVHMSRGLIAIIALISWIVYWIKVINYKKRLRLLRTTTML